MEAKDIVNEILKKADKYARDLANNTEGNFKQEDIDAIYQDANMEIFKAGIREVIKFLHKQGAVWVDKNYAIIEAIEKMANGKPNYLKISHRAIMKYGIPKAEPKSLGVKKVKFAVLEQRKSEQEGIK